MYHVFISFHIVMYNKTNQCILSEDFEMMYEYASYMYFDVFDLHTVTLIDKVRSVMLTIG